MRGRGGGARRAQASAALWTRATPRPTIGRMIEHAPQSGEFPVRPLVQRLVLPLLLTLLACADAPAPVPTRDGAAAEPAAVVFAPELEIDLDAMMESGTGVYVQDMSIGRGAVAEPGRTVTFEYRAWLADGTLYEERPSPEGFGAPELVLGDVQPPGLNEAIEGMRSGGVRRVVITPQRGYGLVGRPAGVPAGATVVFEVRLRSVTGSAEPAAY